MVAKWSVSLLVVLALIGLAVPSGAVWETHQGSDPRPNHCQPIPDPSWSPPGLEWVLTKEESFPRGGPSWVLPANGTAWASHADRLLVSVSESGVLGVHNESFDEMQTVEIGDTFPFVELMDVEGTGVPQIMVPIQGRALYGLEGELIRRYEPEPMAPTMATAHTYIWPAVGDFTHDEHTEVVFAGEWEWHAFRADGEMIARENTLADKRNTAGWTDLQAHTENGQDYIYLLTANEGDYSEDIYSRLHKVKLQKNLPEDVPSQTIAPQDGPLGLKGTLLPYRFEHTWMREFHTDSYDSGISFFDMTGDGADEIIIAHAGRPMSGTGGFTILNLEGDILYALGEPLTGFVAVGDMRGDEVPEVVSLVAQRSLDENLWLDPPSHVVGVQWNGEKFDEVYRFQADNGFGGRFLTLCDVDGDGADELLVTLGEPSRVPDERGFNAGEGKAKLFDVNGTVLWEYRMFFGQPWYGVIIDDFTGDGSYEFIIPNNVGQFLVFSPAQDRSIQDYKRVFDALLERGNRMPTEEQVEAWLSQVDGNATGSHGNATSNEPESGAAPFPAMSIVMVTAALALRAHQSSTRGRHPA